MVFPLYLITLLIATSFRHGEFWYPYIDCILCIVKKGSTEIFWELLVRKIYANVYDIYEESMLLCLIINQDKLQYILICWK